MIEATLLTQYIDKNGTSNVSSETLEADMAIDVERSNIETTVENAEVTVTFATAQLLMAGIAITKSKGETGDKTYILTVKTNSADTPDDTFTIRPSNGLSWSKNDPRPNPFTTDVTKLYITNSGTGKCDLSIRMLVDSTPGLTG